MLQALTIRIYQTTKQKKHKNNNLKLFFTMWEFMRNRNQFPSPFLRLLLIFQEEKKKMSKPEVVIRAIFLKIVLKFSWFTKFCHFSAVQQSDSVIQIHTFFFFVCLFVFFRAALADYGSSQARGASAELHQLAYHTATDPSCICDLHCSLGQCWILNPLNQGSNPHPHGY